MTVQEALEQMVSGLLRIYGDLINNIILYGSVARGTQTNFSDVDIAVIMRPGASTRMHEQMLDLVVDLELACDKVLSVIRIDSDTFREWEDALPFYRNIRKEGVILWPAA